MLLMLDFIKGRYVMTNEQSTLARTRATPRPKAWWRTYLS